MDDAVWDTYADNLAASMARHPAGSKRPDHLVSFDGPVSVEQAAEIKARYQRMTADDWAAVGTPIYDKLACEQYDPDFDRRLNVALATLFAMLGALCVLIVIAHFA